MQWSYSLESSSRLFHISCKKKFLREAISVKKNHHLGLWGCSWRLPLGYFWLLIVSAVTLTHAEFKTLKWFCFTKTQISPSKISRKNAGVIITMSWVWLIFRQLRQWEFVDVWKHSAQHSSAGRWSQRPCWPSPSHWSRDFCHLRHFVWVFSYDQILLSVAHCQLLRQTGIEYVSVHVNFGLARTG